MLIAVQHGSGHAFGIDDVCPRSIRKFDFKIVGYLVVDFLALTEE